MAARVIESQRWECWMEADPPAPQKGPDCGMVMEYNHVLAQECILWELAERFCEAIGLAAFAFRCSIRVYSGFSGHLPDPRA